MTPLSTRATPPVPRRASVAAVALALLAPLVWSAMPSAGAASSSAAEPVRASARTLKVSTTSPVPGDTVKFSGKAAKPGKRIVRLQVKRNGVWATTAKTRTKKSGAYTFRRAVRTDARFRVLAPAVTKRVKRADGSRRTKKVAAKWVSSQVVVRPRLITTTLALTGGTSMTVGSQHEWMAKVTPAVKNRRLSVQLHRNGKWQETAHLRTGATGAVRLPDLGLAVGEHRVRVIAAATARTASATAERRFTVRAATPQPDPDAELDPTVRDTAQGLHLRGSVPVVRVTSPEPILTKTTYVRSQVTIDADNTQAADGTALPSHDLSARLRVRGNSTSWVTMKLPYKVKLDERTSLLGMPASKDYVLLANFYDRSLLRNTAAFEAARRIGMPWSPRMVDVDLYVNGTYKGVYQLGEGIEVEPGRVDLGADDLPETPDDGGFLIEADHWDDTDPRFTTAKGIQFYLKEFGSESDEYREALAAQMQEFEDVLYSDDFLDEETGYRRLVDLRSFADWYLAHELTKSTEANFGTSVWMQRAVGGKLSMGPPWDFDQSAGVRNSFGIDDPEGWFVHRGPLKPGVARALGMVTDGPHWIQRMLHDPEFRALVQQRWVEVSPGLTAMVSDLARHADRLEDSAVRNFAPIPSGAGMFLGKSLLDENDMVLHHTTWRGHADSVVSWYRNRIAWLDKAIPTLGSDKLP
ncbi:CotH kinase family protein [Nocardioides yefusunii]|uniref:CotH kinase family protein n=1 Tax=Nocardioides yefusunii TaxID=2500546 RepID=A0ABW1QT24_9ACTN|nr:CotH kinase family protein [Nocardioides yefusunii]